MTLNRTQILTMIGAMLEGELSPKVRADMFKVYVDVAGMRRAKERKKYNRSKIKQAPGPTLNEMIVQFEKESKNGQQHSERQGREVGQENENNPTQ